jgi:hypothetical protein
MGLIREPKNVDFTVIDNPWTDEERKEFSELIRDEKAKHRTRILSQKTKERNPLPSRVG